MTEATSTSQTTIEVTPKGIATPAVVIRVLHVEDNLSDVALMQERLRGILPSVSFDEAVRLADLTPSRAAAADCALLDLSLPDASGLEALLVLRQMSDRLPIIVLTGLDDMDLGLAAVREGADDYLVKNHVDGYTVERSIQYAMERRRLLLRLDSSIAETIIAEASTITVGEAMLSALQLLEQTLVTPPSPPAYRGVPAADGAGVELDRQARELERELESEIRDWLDDKDQGRPPKDGETRDTAGALDELNLIVLNDRHRNANLVRIIQLAQRAIPTLVDASVIILDEAGGRSAVFTGPLAVELDEFQLQTGWGPSLDAALTVDPLVIATDADSPYQHFALAARRAGVTHSLSFSLPVAERIVGALNLYVASAGPVDPDTIAMGQTFASCVAVVVADTRSHSDVLERAGQIQEATRTRSTIEQAKGILIARNQYTSLQAFETLTFVAQHMNRTIGEVAAALLTTSQQSTPDRSR